MWYVAAKKKSERRDSNPRQSRWQRDALPAELLSLNRAIIYRTILKMSTIKNQHFYIYSRLLALSTILLLIIRDFFFWFFAELNNKKVTIARIAIIKVSLIFINICGDAGNWTRVRERTAKDIYILSHSLNLIRLQVEWRPYNLTILINTRNITQAIISIDPPKMASISNTGRLESEGCDSIIMLPVRNRNRHLKVLPNNYGVFDKPGMPSLTVSIPSKPVRPQFQRTKRQRMTCKIKGRGKTN